MQIAWLVAVYSLMQLLFAPWWGRLSDRRGRRPILLIGLVGSGLSYLLFAVAGSLGLLFAARILAGVMGANIGVAQACVADLTSEEDRARGMGMIGAAFGLGFIFGPAIGGVLSAYGASVPFWGAALLTFSNALLAVGWLPETRGPRDEPGEAEGTAQRFANLFRLVGAGGMSAFYLAFFLITFAFAELEATLSLFADRQWSLSAAEIAWVFAYLGVIATVVQGLLVGPLSRKLGEWRLALLGGAAFAIGLGLLPLGSSRLGVAIALAVIAFGQGTTIPAVSSLISRSAPEESQGQLLGVSQSLSALGRVVGPVIGGFVFAGIGISAPYFTGAALAAIAVVAIALLSSPPQPAARA